MFTPEYRKKWHLAAAAGRRRIALVAILIATAGSSAGCRYNTIDNSLIVNPTGPVSFASDVLPILQTGCDGFGCHVGFNTNGVEVSSYSELVTSTGAQYGQLIVNPNDGSGSALIDKLLANPRFGQRMPLDAPLSATDIQTIRTWIDEGAQDN